MQRVTRYPFLVEKILEKTPVDHDDYSNTNNARDWAQHLCSRVNEGIRLHENVEHLKWMQEHVKLNSMENRLVFNSETNFLGNRELLHNGCLTKVNSGKELVAFLLTDMLLFALPETDRAFTKVSNIFVSDHAFSTFYRAYRQPYFLGEIEVIQNSDRSSMSSSSSSPSVDSQLMADPTVFALNRKRDKEGIMLLRALSVNDRAMWMKQLTTAIRVYQDRHHQIETRNFVGRRSSVIDASQNTAVP